MTDAEIAQLKLDHAAALEAQAAQCQATLDEWGERYRLGIEKQQKSLDEIAARLEALKQTHAAELAAVQDKADFRVSQYALAHKEALTILQESPEARELRVQQAREAAEVAARQEAARQALAAKLSG